MFCVFFFKGHLLLRLIPFLTSCLHVSAVCVLVYTVCCWWMDGIHSIIEIDASPVFLSAVGICWACVVATLQLWWAGDRGNSQVSAGVRWSLRWNQSEHSAWCYHHCAVQGLTAAALCTPCPHHQYWHQRSVCCKTVTAESKSLMTAIFLIYFSCSVICCKFLRPRKL